MLGDWKRASASRTLVDSAPAGTHCDVSFFSACLSFTASGHATASTATQKPTTSHLVQLPAGISAIFRSVLIGPPRVVLASRLPATVARLRRRRYPCEYADQHRSWARSDTPAGL